MLFNMELCIQQAFELIFNRLKDAFKVIFLYEALCLHIQIQVMFH